jgi:predicted permease
MQIPLLVGRTLSSRDDANAPRVAVVNQALARRFFPNENPVGKRFAFDSTKPDSVEIIGVAKDAKYARQRDEIPPTAYLSWQQDLGDEYTLELRTRGDASALIPSVRRAVRELDAQVPIREVKTQTQRANETLRMERLFARLLMLFGALAQVLASVGLFGVMAYSVSRRTHEIGIRMALGGTRQDILKLIMRQTIELALIGIAIGLVGTFATTRLFESRLYSISRFDPVTFLSVATLLIAIAALASWLPARRAARVSPVVALRCD